MRITQPTIKELKSEQEWIEDFPIMKQLRTHLNTHSFIELVSQAVEENDYQLFALYDENRIVAVCGFMPTITLYNGKSIWVCDLVTDSSLRSKGYGKTLLNYVEHWAKKQNYDVVSLSSGLQRASAHQFYEEKMEYGKTSYVFVKKL